MRKLLLILTCAATISSAQDNAAALQKLRSLAGDWEGTLEWTGARTGTGPVSASYYETGGGSAVVENLIMGGVPTMTSVYHLDGADLRMTHYCGAQNQPRLKASRIDLAEGELDFKFVDITNLKSPDAGHVVGVELRLLAADHFILTFEFLGAGKTSRERIDLKRVSAKPPAIGATPSARDNR